MFYIFIVLERGFIEEIEIEKKFKERIREIIEERDVFM